MTDNDMPEYAIDATNSLHHGMPESAIVHAVLGVAYELRTANLLALDHALGLMRQVDPLGDGEDLAVKVSTEILERLGYSSSEPGPSRPGCE